jgi:DNA polymerase elongation subunit (family B)
MRGGGGGHGYGGGGGGSGGASGRPQTRFCLSVTMEMKKSIMGYSPGGLKPFLRISLATPNLVAPARGIMESGLSLGGGDGGGGATGSRAFLTYESNVLYTLRFMVDKGVVGGCWVTLPRGRYCLGPAGRVGAGAVDASSPKSPASHSTATHCQIEAHIHARDLVAHAPEGEWARLAPLRVLSFDIECAGRKVWTFSPFFPHFFEAKKKGSKRTEKKLTLCAFSSRVPNHATPETKYRGTSRSLRRTQSFRSRRW